MGVIRLRKKGLRMAARLNETTLILVRHGETEGNVQRVWHGSMDAPLTVRGRLQVEATARYIADLHEELSIRFFYVSPLQRTQSTGAAIADAIGLQPSIEPGLREFHLGDWEGRTVKELGEIERLWERWAADPTFAPPNGESPALFNERAIQIAHQLVDRHPGGTILAVTHGGIIANVLNRWLSDGQEPWETYAPHNCAVSVIRGDGMNWEAVQLNTVDHLPIEAVVAHDWE
jgi:broad specificity phosphatase PhoE